MAKRKRKKRGLSRFGSGFLWQRHPTSKLETAFEQADALINAGRAHEAVTLLEPYLASHSKEAELHYYIGYAHVKAGDFWGGLAGYERALDLSGDTGYWLPLASLYLQVGMNTHALNGFRQVLKHRLDTPDFENIPNVIASLEEDVAEAARQVDIPVKRMEEGLRYLENGQRALNEGDYQNCINANRQAIKLLKDWPPPHNNLSLALFFDGQPQAALNTAQRVLADAPNNLQALSNSIRFLVWTGQKIKALDLWTTLQPLTPLNNTECMKKAEAAAILEQDEDVYALLKPLEKSGLGENEAPGALGQIELFLAIAEANTNRQPSAKRRLKLLKRDSPWAKELLSALQEGKQGPGYADRFPYFQSAELIPRGKLEEFVKLAQREDKMPSQKFQELMADFVARFPQMVLMAEKLIFEESHPEAGIAMLATIGTPAAYSALRRFALSQTGEDDIRMRALFRLQEADQFEPGESLRVWNKGQWQEVQLRQIEISDEPDEYYAPEVAELINRATGLLQKQKVEQAEKLFKQVLKLEPKAKEAYNNLAVIYTRRDDHEKAKEMYYAAIDIDPTYVFPRTNLALYLLDEDDIEGAEAMLAPLAEATRFQPQEMAVFNYAQARVLMYREEFEAARTSLGMALEIWPDYEAAQDLLEHLETVTPLMTGWKSFMERQRQQNVAQRTKLQGKLATSKPSLAEALPLYSKEVLTGMGRVVIRGGGWSALHKAELLERIIGELSDEDNLSRLVAGLVDVERRALREVLENDGMMVWDTFEDRYDNDLKESPYWQYHTPKTVMGRLRVRGLLVEATVDKQRHIVVPLDIRQALSKILARI